MKLCRCPVCHRFQSLWNRSGSFDFMYPLQPADLHQVSIPLEQGRVFRHNIDQGIERARKVSIPLEQGRVFRLKKLLSLLVSNRFNPFGAGQGLSTIFTFNYREFYCFNPFGAGQGLSTIKNCSLRSITVSIPLEQGRVFRPHLCDGTDSSYGFNPFGAGQGLSTKQKKESIELLCFNPFGAGQGLSTNMH